jgi:hypothetical protein
MYELATGASFADWVDALKEQAAAPAPQSELPRLDSMELQRLEECARRYEQQSALPEDRRSRVSLLLVDVSEATLKSAISYLTGRLALRYSTIDAREIDGQLDDAAADKLQPMVDQFARLVIVTNISNSVDPRVRDAIAWSSRNVLVIGTCDSLEGLGGTIKRHFQYVLEGKRKSLFQRLGLAS